MVLARKPLASAPIAIMYRPEGVPLGAVTVNSELADVMFESNTRVCGLRFVISPPGKDRSMRVIVPLNPIGLVKVIVELPVVPGFRVKKAGFADRLKAGPITSTWKNVVWVIAPLVPVIMTL